MKLLKCSCWEGLPEQFESEPQIAMNACPPGIYATCSICKSTFVTEPEPVEDHDSTDYEGEVNGTFSQDWTEII